MKISNRNILIIFIILAPLFSFFLLGLEFIETRYFLFKENSIKYLSDNSFSIELTQDWVSLEQLPKGAVEALISVEDSRFYNHKGFSPYDIHSAVIHSFLFGKKLRGASTITQQLARTLFLNREKTIKRKLQEIRIAVALEKSLTKKEILEYYLNTVYWGKGFHGIYFASKYHYHKSPNELNLEEFQELVQKLKGPDRTN